MIDWQGFIDWTPPPPLLLFLDHLLTFASFNGLLIPSSMVTGGALGEPEGMLIAWY
jgi:hypothetical protein